FYKPGASAFLNPGLFPLSLFYICHIYPVWAPQTPGLSATACGSPLFSASFIIKGTTKKRMSSHRRKEKQPDAGG
ncbi:hypothetical protein, partial [Bacteroides congonensis]|uniref:hypothetical protein n=1 Tax=Bacteroides congonensis TaxID=1871006 RepID=UPI00321BED2C